MVGSYWFGIGGLMVKVCVYLDINVIFVYKDGFVYNEMGKIFIVEGLFFLN